MEATDKQNAADDRQGGSEGATSGETELDVLLKQYETETDRRAEPDNAARILKGLGPVVEFAKSRMEQDADQALDNDLKKASEFITSIDELKAPKPAHVRGFMEAYAVEHPEFSQAFQERGQKPDAWQAALEKGRDWLKDEIATLSSSELKNDIEAAQAAVDGSTEESVPEQKGPSVSQMMAMSGVEWEKFLDAAQTD